MKATKTNTALTSDVRSKVERIQEIYSDWHRDDILRALEENEYDVEEVISKKLRGDEEWSKVSKKEVKKDRRGESAPQRGRPASRGGRGGAAGRGGRGGRAGSSFEGVKSTTDTETTVGSNGGAATSPKYTADVSKQQEQATAAPVQQPVAVEEPKVQQPKPLSFADIAKRTKERELAQQKLKEQEQKSKEAAVEAAPVETAAPVAASTDKKQKGRKGKKDQQPVEEQQQQPAVEEVAEVAPAVEEPVEEQAAPVEEQPIEEPAPVEEEEIVEQKEEEQPVIEEKAPVVVQQAAPEVAQPTQPAPQQQAMPAESLILPQGLNAFPQSTAGLDLQFGSLGISDDQQYLQAKQVHQQEAAAMQHVQQPVLHQAQQQPIMPQLPHHIPPQLQQPFYNWPQQMMDQSYQSFFGQAAYAQQPQLAAQPQQGRPQQAKDQAVDKQEQEKQGYQQGSSKYMQTNPYAQMPSAAQFAFPQAYGYPYMMPSQYQYPGSYPAPANPKSYPGGFGFNKQGYSGYGGYQGVGAQGAQSPAGTQKGYGVDEQAQQAAQQQPQQPMAEYSGAFASGYQYPQQQQQQPMDQKARGGAGASKRGARPEAVANPYAQQAYQGYPNAYQNAYMGYGPAPMYPQQSAFMGAGAPARGQQKQGNQSEYTWQQ